jgi:VWFA-related protein
MRFATFRHLALVRLRAVSLCALGGLFVAGVAFAQDAPAQNPPAQNAPPPATTPPSSKSDQPPATTTDNYRPSLLKKNPPATPPQSAPAPNPSPATTPPVPATSGATTPAMTPPNAGGPAATGSAASANPPLPSTSPANASTPGNAAPGAPPSSAGVPNATSEAVVPGATSPANTSAASSATGPAVSAATPAAPPATEPLAEMTTRTAQVPLESHVNLVPVRVIVHDSHGNAVGDLREADFEIRQDGKPQVISHFSVETPASLAGQVVRGIAGDKPDGGAPPAEAKAGITLPSRFVALVVDDAHLEVGDLTRVRLAAIRYLKQSVKPNERVALFTVSGQSQVDFTDDREKIESQLKVLIPRPVGAFDPATQHDCLVITYYQADLIQNRHDPQATDAANADAVACAIAQGAPNATLAQSIANSMVASTVAEVVQAGEINTQYSIRRLDEIVRRISAMPGQRSMVLISPGFLTSTYEYDVLQVVDRAARQNVFINTLDARGLYTIDPLGDISQPIPLRANSATSGISLQYRIDEQRVDSEVLSDLANSTGGFYFRNNNDLDAGLMQTASEPAVSYLLAFVPSDLKNDGKFHTVNVKLLTKEKYTVQARRGFFAPKHGKTPDELAKQDIEDAVFSQEEQQGLPVQLNLQYFKVDEGNARLSVLTHVDITQVRFDRNDDRNSDDLTIVAALFDRNGNFIRADQKTLEMHLKDATLEKLHRSGVTVKTNFDVKPGGYMVRLVVRDARASQLGSRNGVVDIP